MSYNELFDEIHLKDETAQPHDKPQIPNLRQILKFLKFDNYDKLKEKNIRERIYKIRFL